MDDAPVKPGDVLGGKYRVERVLGSGSMGVIVAAEHLELGQRVALKFLLPSALQNTDAAARFLRETRAAMKIESEHVARVLDVGRLAHGAPYVVMEFLEGEALSTQPRGEALPIEVALDYVLQACEGMAVAHAAGIIHRDLKPSNLFLTTGSDGSPCIKVLDFGISTVNLLDAAPALTHTSAFIGSPVYMSPEQARSPRTVDARTDIWSLGVTLYELLTGVPPFAGETLREVVTQLLTAEPKPVRLLRPSVPLGLERAVLRALERSLDQRYASIAEFSGALVEFAAPESRILHERVLRVQKRAFASMVPSVGTIFPSLPPPPLETPPPPLETPPPRPEPVTTFAPNGRLPPAAFSQSPKVPPAPKLPSLSYVSTGDRTSTTLRSVSSAPGGLARPLPLIGTLVAWVRNGGVRRGSTPLVVGVSIGLLGAALSFLLLGEGSRRPNPEPATQPATAPGEAQSSPTSPLIFEVIEGTQVPQAPPAASKDDEPTAPALPPARKTQEPPRSRRPRSAPSPAQESSARAPGATASAGSACDPPYFFKHGIKTYRPECL